MSRAPIRAAVLADRRRTARIIRREVREYEAAASSAAEWIKTLMLEGATANRNTLVMLRQAWDKADRKARKRSSK